MSVKGRTPGIRGMNVHNQMQLLQLEVDWQMSTRAGNVSYAESFTMYLLVENTTNLITLVKCQFFLYYGINQKLFARISLTRDEVCQQNCVHVAMECCMRRKASSGPRKLRNTFPVAHTSIAMDTKVYTIYHSSTKNCKLFHHQLIGRGAKL